MVLLLLWGPHFEGPGSEPLWDWEALAGGAVDCKLGCRLSQVSGSEGEGAWLMVTQNCQLRGALMWPDSGPVSPSGLKLLQLFFQGLSSQRSCCRRVGQMWEMLYLPVWPGFRWWEKDFPPVLGARGSCLLIVPHVQDSGVKCSDHYAALDIQGRYWPTLLFFDVRDKLFRSLLSPCSILPGLLPDSDWKVW